MLLFLLLALCPAYVLAQTIDGHPCFRDLDAMTRSMFDLASSNPGLVSIRDVGDSYLKSSGSSNNDYGLDGGYDIYALNITSTSSQRLSASKGKAFFISGVHAREYAPPELLMRFAELLVDSYDVNSDVTWLLEHNEVHLIIYVNPDGRHVAENYPDDFWRKNMNPRGGCSADDEIGVDLNRNYDFMWGDTSDGASSSDPCSSRFHGNGAESEPETRAVVSYAKALFPEGQRRGDPEGDADVPVGDDITGIFADIHAPGGFVIFPYTFEEDRRSPDDDALQALGHKLAYYNGYKLWAPGSDDFDYPTAGESTDYMYGALGVASFSLELGEDFYEDCNNFERDVVPINMPALLHAVKIAKKPFSMIKGPDVLSFDVEESLFDDVKVTVVASDRRLAADLSTGTQGVAGVRLYLDVHPDDYQDGDTAWDMQSGDFGNDARSFEAGVTWPVGLSSGRHVFYAQAVDYADYRGPVTSLFVEVERAATAPPSDGPTLSPTPEPTDEPTPEPSQAPTAKPTRRPTQRPTREPTARPTVSPSLTPSSSPTTAEPSVNPTVSPTQAPSDQPTTMPSNSPTTPSPTVQPTTSPTISPSTSPTSAPTANPSKSPTEQPSTSPTGSPTASASPTSYPTNNPTAQPTKSTPEPSSSPTSVLKLAFTAKPTTTPDTPSDPSFVEKGPDGVGVPSSSGIAGTSNAVTVAVASALVLLYAG